MYQGWRYFVVYCPEGAGMKDKNMLQQITGTGWTIYSTIMFID